MAQPRWMQGVPVEQESESPRWMQGQPVEEDQDVGREGFASRGMRALAGSPIASGFPLVIGTRGLQAFNLSDEAAGLASMATGGTYQAGQQAELQRVQQSRSERPVTTAVEEVIGSAPTGAFGRGAGLLRAATTGGALGAIGGAGAGETLEERAGGAAVGGAIGGVGGAVAQPVVGTLTRGAQAVGNVAGRAMGRAPAQQASRIPASGELREASRAAYKAVDDVGARYNPAATREFVRSVRDDMNDFGLSQSRHPRAYSMLQDIRQRAGTDLSLGELDQLRQVIRRDVAGNLDSAEAAAGQRMIQRLDDFITESGPERMSGGSGPAAAQAIAAARAAHSRFRKVEMFEMAMERAANRAGSTGTGGNYENAMRQEVRRLIENRRTRNLFSAEERQAMQRFVRGSTGENVLRGLSRLSPVGNALSTMLGVGGAMAYGPLGIIPLTGAAAQQGSNVVRAAAERNLQRRLGMTAEEFADNQRQQVLRQQRTGAAAGVVGGVAGSRAADAAPGNDAGPARSPQPMQSEPAGQDVDQQDSLARAVERRLSGDYGNATVGQRRAFAALRDAMRADGITGDQMRQALRAYQQSGYDRAILLNAAPPNGALQRLLNEETP